MSLPEHRSFASTRDQTRSSEHRPPAMDRDMGLSRPRRPAAASRHGTEPPRNCSVDLTFPAAPALQAEHLVRGEDATEEKRE